MPIAQANVEAAQQRLGALRSFPNPVLELVPGIGNREAADEEILLAQPLDLFGQRRARAGVAAAQLKGAEAASTLAQRGLVVQVKNAATQLFAAQEAENLGEVQVQVARLFQEAAARKAELGDAPQVQAQRAELELLRVQNELTAAQAERLAFRAALNQLVGQPPETPLRVVLPFVENDVALLRAPPPAMRFAPLPATPSESTPSLANAPATTAQAGDELAQPDLAGQRSAILPGALLNRPDIVGAQAVLEARQAQVKVFSRERLPTVELQARRSAFFGREGSYALRAVVTLPLIDFGSRRKEKRAVEAEVRAQQATIVLLQAQAAAQVEQALIRLGQQRQTVSRYRTGIVPLAVELLRKTQIGYAAGASTYLEVLEAQRALRQTQTEYLQALVGVRANEASLESALGATPPPEMLGAVANPVGATTPPGVAAPGTVPEGTFPPNTVGPVMGSDNQ